jgi:hypothetical protein
MSLLIISGPADIHASAVAWAVEAYGHRVVQWSPAPPWADPGFVRFAPGRPVDYRFRGLGGEVTPRSVDAVWLRRWPQAHLPASFGDGDRLAARNELAAFHRGVLALLPEQALWANPVAARESANFKLRQLELARAAGLAIPDTLVTDDAAQARDFVMSFPRGSVIYKPFFTFHWQKGDRLYHTVTTPVTERDLDEPEQLRWSPGIFQKFVPKACELRVCIFGRACIAFKITDQDPIDWRTRQEEMKVEPCRLPAAVESRLHRLMDALGLAMGMADIIVTPEGDHVFLEVNEQGQFLWLEEMCPEAGLMDRCARFLASGTRFFQDRMIESANLSFADFLKTSAYEDVEKADRDFRAAGGVRNMLLIKE